MLSTRAYAAKAAGKPLEPYQFYRREPGDQEVLIEILF